MQLYLCLSLRMQVILAAKAQKVMPYFAHVAFFTLQTRMLFLNYFKKLAIVIVLLTIVLNNSLLLLLLLFT